MATRSSEWECAFVRHTILTELRPVPQIPLPARLHGGQAGHVDAVALPGMAAVLVEVEVPCHSSTSAEIAQSPLSRVRVPSSGIGSGLGRSVRRSRTWEFPSRRPGAELRYLSPSGVGRSVEFSASTGCLTAVLSVLLKYSLSYIVPLCGDIGQLTIPPMRRSHRKPLLRQDLLPRISELSSATSLHVRAV